MIEPLEIGSGLFFGIGNPLIDLSKEVDPNFFAKYHVEENHAIIANTEHNQLFKKLDDEARSTSGGSAQNIMRTITWFLRNRAKIAVFMGAVGDDFETNRLIEFANKSGIDVRFDIKQNMNTGRCAVLINENDRKRSMVTDMGASTSFSVEYLNKSENWKAVENAKIMCSEGFFLVSCREAFMRVCEHAYKNNKIFAMTLSAKYICDEPYGVRLLSALAYADIVFGYEDEAKTLAQKQLGVQASDMKTILEALRDAPKWNTKRQRVIVVSRVPERTTVVTNEGAKTYKWKRPDKITDTHGCGAALAGGFLASMALGKTVDQCVNAGLYCAFEILQRLGSLYPETPNYKDTPHYVINEEE